MSLFPVAPAGAGIVQFLYPQIPLACAALSMATLILYQNWLDEMIAIDPLTRLNNRKQLMYQYEQWQGSADPTPLYVLLIDANKFKSINDTYGHIQGDAALCRIADALRQSCGGLPRRANIARYGGDEFVVLVSAESSSTVRTLTERIHATLAKLNERARAPYDLSASVGVAAARGEPEGRPRQRRPQALRGKEEILIDTQKARPERRAFCVSYTGCLTPPEWRR